MTAPQTSSLLSASALACLCGLALSGCMNLKPVVDPARYFVLASSVPPTASTASSADGIALGLALPDYPSYLDNNRLALRKSTHEIQYLDWILWAERLDQGFLRVLSLNLTRSLKNTTVYLQDWKRDAVDFEIYLELVRFEPDKQGLVTLEVEWRITRAGRAQPVRAGTSRVQKQGPPPSEDPDGAVDALTTALGDFSRELAQALQSLPRSGESPK